MPEPSEHPRNPSTARLQGEAMDIDQAIDRVEKLYVALTGHEAPPLGDVPYAQIPPEKDPQRFVEEQLDRLTGLLATLPMAGMGAQRWTPALSVWESGHEYLYCLDLPGVPRDAVHVSLEGNAIIVSGERRAPMGNGAGPFEARWQEREIGAFKRAIMLPPGTTPEQISAVIRDGILELRTPRSVQKAPTVRNIPVS